MMKKLLTFLLISILIITPMQIFAASEDDGSYISVSFDPETRKLSVSGAANIPEGSPVVIAVASDGCVISTENPPVLADMIFASKEGTFYLSSAVPASLKNGKYTVYVGNDATDAMSSKSIIIFLKDSPETDSAISVINAADTYAGFAQVLSDKETALNVGIDLEIVDDYTVFSKALWGIRNTAGIFSVSTIATASSFAKGADVLKSTGSVEKVMQNHAIAFDYSYDEYSSLPSSVKTIADGILIQTPTDNGYISYSKIVAVAKLIDAPSYGHLKDIITSDASLYEISFDSEYNNLSSNDKANVFKKMYAQRKSFKTIDDVSSAFEKAVEFPGESLPDSEHGNVSDSKNHVGGSTSISGLSTTGASLTPGRKFSDIESSFAKESIEKLTSLSIINGYADNTFRPDNSVTRAEFCKIVCLAFGFAPGINDRFEDVVATEWFAPYTGALSGLGIVRGDGTNFNPSGLITRQDAAVILNNALESIGKKNEGTYSFSDGEKISDYAKASVSNLASMGYLKGDGVNFYPTNNITRAETAALVERIYTSLN